MKINEYERERADICLRIMHTGGGDSDPRYTHLLEQALRQGLFKRRYWYYSLHFLFAFAGLALNVYLMHEFSGVSLHFINGLLFGFWSVQIGMIAHDLSHGMVFKHTFCNRFSATIVWCLLGGLSEYYWYEKHNKHHESPNHEGHDPDIDIPFVFDLNQLDQKSKTFKKYILPKQHILFWLVLPLLYFWNIALSILHLFTTLDKKSMIEIFLIVVHFSLLFWYVGSTLSAAEAIGFFSATFTSIGWYMSLVFAPNHKSEEIIDAKKKYSWVSQITSTRNIKPSYLIFFLLGGLNFQVEHHLFPTMPRSAYFKANVLVKEFCCTYDITYEESSWFQSMRDIHISLKSAQ